MMLRGVHVAIALIALTGIGVAIFNMIGHTSRENVGPLAQGRAVAFSSGLLYLLAAALVHFKMFFDFGRKQPLNAIGMLFVLIAHLLIVLAILYCFVVQQLASRALLVGLDPLLSCAVPLSSFAGLAMVGTILRGHQPTISKTRLGLLRAILFLMVAMLFFSSLVWLESLPLP